MKEIRFVEKKDDPNIGFSDAEIQRLQAVISSDFPVTYDAFLRRAGKRSNALSTEFNSVENLIELQQEMLEKIKASDVEEMSVVWCFEKEDAEHYNFFKLNAGENPKVYSYCDIGYLADNGWNPRHGFYNEKKELFAYIKDKTDRKFGAPFKERLFGNIWLLLLLPIILPILLIVVLYFWIKEQFK